MSRVKEWEKYIVEYLSTHRVKVKSSVSSDSSSDSCMMIVVVIVVVVV